MIQCVFTIDYEIFGNGRGSLRELAYEPAERLRAVFGKHNARFVVFPDVAELEMIEANAADPDFELIKKQLRDFYGGGFELGLHIHPWWYQARRENGEWTLGQAEYNLCTQPPARIGRIIDRALAYLQNLLGVPGFVPLSFRAGHLLFQPSRPLSDVLAGRGVRLDSSVYKGGLWRQHKLDYRRAPKKAPYWKFGQDVTEIDPRGGLLEIPIHTRQAAVWRLFTAKRVGLQQTGATTRQTGQKILRRISDFARLRYPLKFDLGQMTRDEMIRMAGRILRDDGRSPSAFRPIVVIGHTKDPIDYEAVDSLLAYLGRSGATVSTFGEVYRRIQAIHEREGG